MKKTRFILLMSVIILILLFLMIKLPFTGKVVAEEKIKLGYCPTMQEEAISLSEKNNYELVEFSSATEVLSALNNNQIDKALVGRKAKIAEINPNTKETILKSGYTLVSNNKGFVEYAQLFSTEIYTYLETENLEFKTNKITKEDIEKIVNQGKIVLISWDDWSDDFELVVVMNGIEKVKDFRGVFLYENNNRLYIYENIFIFKDWDL